MKITNLAEAKEAASALADFLVRFQQFVGTGNVATNTQARSGRTTGQNVMLTKIVDDSIPKTMPERIFEILRRENRPMTPKEMVAKYIALKWPMPKGDLSTALSASAYYLRNTAKKLSGSNGVYFLPASGTNENQS